MAALAFGFHGRLGMVNLRRGNAGRNGSRNPSNAQPPGRIMRLEMMIDYLGPNVAVGPQIEIGDVSMLAREGFTDIVCNRPDTEHPDGPTSQVLAGAANEHGLTFHYLPINPGQPFQAQATELAVLAARSGAKVFAYCRSGARSSTAWSMAHSHVAGAPLS